jgi:hypothetical protein
MIALAAFTNDRPLAGASTLLSNIAFILLTKDSSRFMRMSGWGSIWLLMGLLICEQARRRPPDHIRCEYPCHSSKPFDSSFKFMLITITEDGEFCTPYVAWSNRRSYQQRGIFHMTFGNLPMRSPPHRLRSTNSRLSAACASRACGSLTFNARILSGAKLL